MSRACRLLAAGAILLCSASCIEINEHLGENFIPNDQKWDVFVPDPIELGVGDVVMKMSDSLSAYSSRRFTLGAVTDERGTTVRSTSFTLVPVMQDIDFGENTKILRFMFTAVRDTLSVSDEKDLRILQNIHVHPLKEYLDTTVLYTGEFMDRARLEKYVDLDRRITMGIPVYDGGDSLTFDFSKEFAEEFVESIRNADKDTISNFVQDVPGIYITSDLPAGMGGRINMFEVAMQTDSYGYVTGNYAEIAIRADYGDRKQVDTSFLFMFGPIDFIDDESTTLPSQYAFNASGQTFSTNLVPDPDDEFAFLAQESIFVEGGSGLKPVVKARKLKELAEKAIRDKGIEDLSNVVINKATIVFPFDASSLSGGWSDVNLFPTILSPTVRLRSSSGGYVSYAGLTDSSIESENQGDINRSLAMYSPDISHHVQEIIKIDSNAEDFDTSIENYDIWLLIMHEETTTTSNDSSYSDYYNNLLYNSYYNSMMYDPYGYGYGYGYGSYGYGYGSYGYSNYYNYLMMASYASGSSTTTETSTDLDRDRYYKCMLCGPKAPEGSRPRLLITFSVPNGGK
ncbi:MAG: hypothetical protein ACI3ZL_02955 [Candidatus Cryptobacteroides sp.]